MSDHSDREIQDLLQRKEFGKAEAMIRERLREEPDSADPYYLMGVLHYFQGQLGPTVEHLRRALSLDPQHTDAAICLSVLFNDIGKYDEAKRVFEQANQSVAHKRTGDDMGIDRKFAVKHMELASEDARRMLADTQEIMAAGARFWTTIGNGRSRGH